MIPIRVNVTLREVASCLAFVSVMTLTACGGGGGGGGNSSSGGPAPDTTPPDTTVAGTPATPTSQKTASFTFTSTETGSTFESRLDGAAFAVTTSPQNLTGLGEGSHTFEVRARDAAGNVDATPASTTWTVDSVAPDTTITAQPSTTAPVASASFGFSSSETGSTFEVSIDGSTYVAATSPYAVTGILDGQRTFRVRARDAAGNTDATPATANFVLDTVPPTATITFPLPITYTEATFLHVSGRADDASGISEVTVNGVAAAPVGGDLRHWTTQIPIEVKGANDIVVNVTDNAGKTTTNAASAVVHNRGPSIELLQGLTYDPAGDRVLAVDQGAAKLYAYDAATGLGRLVADLSPLWPLPETPTAAAVVVDGTRALVVDRSSDKLGSVNLANGAVTVASASPGANQPTSLSFGSQLALDAANLRLFVTSGEQNTVMSINLVTGVRTIVASNSVGSGPALNYPGGIVYDNVTTPGTPRLLVTDGTFPSAGVYAVNISNGNRTVFSGTGGGTGPTMTSPACMVLDAAHNRVLVTDAFASTVFAIDLNTGNRSYVANTTTGSGLPLTVGSGLALNPATGRAFVGTSGQSILQIDLATLDRTHFAGTRLGSGPSILNAYAPLLENDHSLLYLDAVRQSLMRIDLLTGDRSVASGLDTQVGIGPALDTPADLALDTRAPSPGSRALVLMGAPGGAILSVDLANGNRTQLGQLGNFVTAHQPRSLVVDAPGNRALILDNDNFTANADGLYAMNLDTGAVTTISDTTGVGGGAGFGVPIDLVLEPFSNPTRALVSQIAGGNPVNGPNILSIDLATGTRSVFAAASGAPGGIAIPMPTWLFLDWSNTRLLGINAYPANLYQVPLDTRVRGFISGTVPGTFNKGGTGMFGFGQGLDVDAFNRHVAYTFAKDNSLMAIDLASGDRVLVSH